MNWYNTPLALVEYFLYASIMQLVCYIDRKDFPLLDENQGYSKSDRQASDVRLFLERHEINYVTPFVCVGVLPDEADPDDALHPLHAYGDTPVILRPEIANEAALACISDLQTTAVNALKANRAPRGVLFDLTKISSSDKVVCLRKLCSYFDKRSYPEMRIYRTITWSDVEPSCSKRLRLEGQDPGDILMDLNSR